MRFSCIFNKLPSIMETLGVDSDDLILSCAEIAKEETAAHFAVEG